MAVAVATFSGGLSNSLYSLPVMRRQPNRWPRPAAGKAEIVQRLIDSVALAVWE
jgi:hypothetical protein